MASLFLCQKCTLEIRGLLWLYFLFLEGVGVTILCSIDPAVSRIARRHKGISEIFSARSAL